MEKIPDHLFISSSDGGLYDTRDPEWSLRPPLRAGYYGRSRDIATVAEFKASLRAGGFTSLGAYTIAYVTSDGACLCDDCARAEFRQIVAAIRDRDHSGWRVVAITHAGETDEQEYCDHCNRHIFGEGE